MAPIQCSIEFIPDKPPYTFPLLLVVIPAPLLHPAPEPDPADYIGSLTLDTHCMHNFVFFPLLLVMAFNLTPFLSLIIFFCVTITKYNEKN